MFLAGFCLLQIELYEIQTHCKKPLELNGESPSRSLRRRHEIYFTVYRNCGRPEGEVQTFDRFTNSVLLQTRTVVDEGRRRGFEGGPPGGWAESFTVRRDPSDRYFQTWTAFTFHDE